MTKLASYLSCITSMEGASVRDTTHAGVRWPAPELAACLLSAFQGTCTPVLVFQRKRAHNISLVAEVLFEAACEVANDCLVAALVSSEIAKSWNRSHLGLVWGRASCVKSAQKLTAPVSTGFWKVDLVTVEKLAIVWVLKVRHRMSPSPWRAGPGLGENGRNHPPLTCLHFGLQCGIVILFEKQ